VTIRKFKVTVPLGFSGSRRLLQAASTQHDLADRGGRWSSDLSFNTGQLSAACDVSELMNGITAQYATLRDRVYAAQRGILMSREVSGGGLAHQGHTPSTSGSRPS